MVLSGLMLLSLTNLLSFCFEILQAFHTCKHGHGSFTRGCTRGCTCTHFLVNFISVRTALSCVLVMNPYFCCMICSKHIDMVADF